MSCCSARRIGRVLPQTRCWLSGRLDSSSSTRRPSMTSPEGGFISSSCLHGSCLRALPASSSVHLFPLMAEKRFGKVACRRGRPNRISELAPRELQQGSRRSSQLLQRSVLGPSPTQLGATSVAMGVFTGVGLMLLSIVIALAGFLMPPKLRVMVKSRLIEQASIAPYCGDMSWIS